VGHLLECAGQVTGGYFADPPWDIVNGLADLGFPLAEVSDDYAIITKLDGTGGRVDLDTVLAQLSYEVMDPARYLTPDVTADFSEVRVETAGPDRARVSGARGTVRPDALKVTVGYWAGYQCEAEISYAGHGARARAQLAASIVTSRLAPCLPTVAVDIVGVDPLVGPDGTVVAGSGECRLRLAAIAGDRSTVTRLGEEVTALYTNGPAGGGGVRAATSEVIGVISTSVDRGRVEPSVTVMPL
jgi:Acyclic terpene utilisation family protein AtuA